MVRHSAILSTLPISGVMKAATGNILDDNLNDKLGNNVAAKTIK
jgi:hypothetical protein